jgi:DNA-binding NtrC family response regulator
MAPWILLFSQDESWKTQMKQNLEDEKLDVTELRDIKYLIRFVKDPKSPRIGLALLDTTDCANLTCEMVQMLKSDKWTGMIPVLLVGENRTSQTLVRLMSSGCNDIVFKEDPDSSIIRKIQGYF